MAMEASATVYLVCGQMLIFFRSERDAEGEWISLKIEKKKQCNQSKGMLTKAQVFPLEWITTDNKNNKENYMLL